MKLFREQEDPKIDPQIDRFQARQRSRQLWARRLGLMIYGLLFTGLLGMLAVAGFIYFTFIKNFEIEEEKK